MSRSNIVTAALLLALPLMACPGADAPTVHSFTSGPEGFDTTTYWVDTGAEVVVFDAQFTPELAEAMIADIQGQTDSPIRYVIATHPNPDKFNGATAFQDIGAAFVASQATADALPGVHAYKEAYFVGAGAFEAGAYPELPEVDITFDSVLELDLEGDVSITLTVLENPGVSSTQSIALMQGAVIVGDLVAGSAHAWLEGGIVEGLPDPDLEAWDAALLELLDLASGEATLYPGRGIPQPLATAVAQERDYLRGMGEVVSDYVDGLEDPAAELGGDDAWGHYEAITAQAEARFPGYDLSYLVTYGVYGLALREAGLI